MNTFLVEEQHRGVHYCKAEAKYQMAFKMRKRELWHPFASSSLRRYTYLSLHLYLKIFGGMSLLALHIKILLLIVLCKNGSRSI